MMKLYIYILFLCALPWYSHAQKGNGDLQEKKWELKGMAGLNLSQTSMSNWAAGGENTLAGNAYMNGSLTRKGDRWLWVSNMALDYGLSKAESQGVRKSSDKIELSTQLGYSVSSTWYCTAAVDFSTQFAKGYDYPDKSHHISRFLAPAYSNIALGMEYRSKGNFSLLFSPLTGKMTIVRDSYLSSIGAFGVDAGKRFKMECGSSLTAKAELKVMENVNMITTTDFFTPYSSQFGNVDINWDVLVSMKINRYLSASVNLALKYDNDVKTYDDEGNSRGARLQFKEIIGVGLAYNF